MTVPVVVGHPDLAIVDTMIGIVLAYLDATEGSHLTEDSGTGEDGLL